MKKALSALLFVVAAFVMTACATAPHQTPAQVAAQVCPQLQAVNAAVADTPGILAPADAAHLAKATPYVDKVCSAATAAPTKPDLKALASTAVPILLDVLGASGLPEIDKVRISFGVNLAKSLIAQQLAEEAAEASVPVAAPPASAAQ